MQPVLGLLSNAVPARGDGPRAPGPARQNGCVNLLTLHQRLYESTDGRLGHRIIGVPSLLLRTTGRKSGQIRTSALVYARDGQDYVLVASNGGSDRPPGWLYNIEAKPETEIQVGRTRSGATARVLRPEDQDYARLWKLVNDRNHGRYDQYQTRTRRPIPLVIVSPAT